MIMKALSISFTLGKSGSGDVNIGHNNREYLADNVDANRIQDNVVYVNEEIRDVYDELFGEAVEEYNAKQKQPCRRIHDYYERIENGNREESCYEVVVQFGDVFNAGIGTAGGELASKMLEEYAKGFQERNPNLRVYGNYLHRDEASPHLHIDFVPFYTKGRVNGLSKGVSMKAALDEMGFTAKHVKDNRLMAWQDSERKVLEQILKRHGLEREVKNDDSIHQSVSEYKQSQHMKTLCEIYKRDISVVEVTVENMEKLIRENTLLGHENDKLTAERSSPWKSFFYSDAYKQSFVQAQLNKLNIPYRETESGFEAQEIFTEQIRKIEKQYKPKSNTCREVLRDTLDKAIMQSKTFDDVLEKMKSEGYDVKQGKYLALRPKYADNFIRTKSLGESYSEQAIRNRLIEKNHFAWSVEENLVTAKNELNKMTCKTMKQYMIVFVTGTLPIRKKNKKKPFTWENDAELDRLAELNRKIDRGMTIEGLKEKYEKAETRIAFNEEQLEKVSRDKEVLPGKLYQAAFNYFNFSTKSPADKSFLDTFGVTENNYKQTSECVDNYIALCEKLLSEDRKRLEETADTLALLEKVVAGTYIDSLVNEEKHRAQAKYIANGTKSADVSLGEVEKIDKLITKHDEAGVLKPLKFSPKRK
jgi:hypothetical protein